MRRYRKGQIFRPPSAAESAASADTIETFRSSPAAPQDRPTRGSDILVKTPGGGIAARSGTTIFSAVCTRCVETSFADEKTILDTDEDLVVFNTHATDIAGDEYVMTKLTATGMRYAELDTAYRWGKLDGALNSGSTAVVSLWQTTGGGWGGWDEDSTENWTSYAPPLLTSGSIASGKWVLVGIVNGRKVVLLHEC